MKRDQVLQVLYDLALVSGGETRVEPLVTRTLQRLLYHTPFNCGIFFSNITKDEPENQHEGQVEVLLLQIIGGGSVRQFQGKTLRLPIELLFGPPGLFEDAVYIESIFGTGCKYRAGLRLPVDENHLFMLFSPGHPELDLQLERVFQPILQNFRKTLLLCIDNERVTNELKEELETRRRLEDVLVKKEKLAVLGQLTATVNHELRNPLAAITTALYAMRLKDQQMEGAFARLLDIIDRSTFRCTQIIEEMLDFARHGEINLEVVLIDSWLFDLVQEMDLDKTVKVNFQSLLPEGFATNLDEGRFRRAILNVLENASNAMEENQAAGSESSLSITTSKKNDFLVIEIVDSGIGISPEIMDRIFEPLFSTKNFGVGLGMPIVRNIVNEHGGDIDIKSEVGKGTSVNIRVPVGIS